LTSSPRQKHDKRVVDGRYVAHVEQAEATGRRAGRGTGPLPAAPGLGRRPALVLRRVFGPLTEDLQVSRIDADPGLPEYGYTGMVLMRGRRRARPTG